MMLGATLLAVLLFYLLRPSPRRIGVASNVIWQRVLKTHQRERDTDRRDDLGILRNDVLEIRPLGSKRYQGRSATAFADEHGLIMISIADMIRFRRRTESLVTKVAEATIPTEFGDFVAHGYRSDVDGVEHLALVRGKVGDGEGVLWVNGVLLLVYALGMVLAREKGARPD